MNRGWIFVSESKLFLDSYLLYMEEGMVGYLELRGDMKEAALIMVIDPNCGFGVVKTWY